MSDPRILPTRLPLRRTVLSGLLAAGALPVLAACGSSDDSASTSGGSSGDAEDGAFPVTIEHKYGSTTLTEAPKRVVCVGLVEQDALLALGVAPVAVTKWFGEAPGQIFPWATDDLGDSKVPTVLTDTNGIQIEKVINLAPDLIIAQYSGMTKKEYDLLSKAAKTVAQSGEYVDFGMPWEESTANIGAAVGKPAAAKALVSKVQGQITKDGQANPDFAGRTAVVVTPYEGLFVYGPEDPRGRILDQLGFTFPEQLLDPSSKEFGWSLSAERTTDLADVDAVVWLGTEKQVDEGTGGLWSQTKAAKEGRGFFISEEDGDYYVAQSMVTPLSIPYVLERYVPQLAAAVDGDTATKVPAPEA